MRAKGLVAGLWAAILPLAALVGAAAPPQPAAEPIWQKHPDGLEIQELRAGEGVEARVGSIVEVHYTGWLADGSVFDSSRERGKPYVFRLGLGAVIQGWDEGIVGMKPGGIRKLRIPPALAYGARGAGDVIPPDSTLLFDLELVAIRGAR
jgi:FKBP-type peptidyl-prolyl cis-trans isomerase